MFYKHFLSSLNVLLSLFICATGHKSPVVYPVSHCEDVVRQGASDLIGDDAGGSQYKQGPLYQREKLYHVDSGYDVTCDNEEEEETIFEEVKGNFVKEKLSEEVNQTKLEEGVDHTVEEQATDILGPAIR